MMDNKAFKDAINLLVKEKGISKEVIIGAMELALTSAYKKNYHSLSNVRVDVNGESGEVHVYSFKTVVPDNYEELEQKLNALPSNDAFLNGQIIMTIGSSAGAAYHVARDGSFETGIAPYPQKAGASEDEKYVIQQGTNITLMKNQNKIKELLGWLFIKYLTNYESSLEFSTNTSYFTVRKDVINSEEYQEYLNRDNIYSKAEKVAISQFKYFYSTPSFPGSKNLRNELEILIPTIIYCQDQYTVEKAIKEALERING